MRAQDQDDRAFMMACYTLSLAQGSNLVCRAIKSDTISAYVREASNMCKFQGTMDPRLDQIGNSGTFLERVKNEMKRWEKMPDRQEPVTREMIDYIIDLAAKDKGDDTLLKAMSDWLVVGEYTGARLSEWAQDAKDTRKGQIKLAIDDSAKAFTREDFIFMAPGTKTIKQGVRTTLEEEEVDSLDIRWRWQKNNVNGQKIRFNKNKKNRKHCIVKAGVSIRKRSQRLKVKNKKPIAVYLDHEKKVKHITNKDIEKVLQHAAKKVYGITDKKELQRFSSHSIRVGAATALHMTGCTGDYIKIRLRWKSDTYMLYLRNVPRLADSQNDALNSIDEVRAEIIDPEE